MSVMYDQTLPAFDELVELAENNPKSFDEFKHRMCEQAIKSASQEMQPRLRAQQSHIDRVISRCKNPYHTNLVLAQELRMQVNRYQELLDSDWEERPTATIIPFTHRH